MARFVWAIALFGAIAAPAAAQDSVEERARAHFAAGQEHVTAREYGEAHAQFALGFALSGRPLFLFNMAECSFLDGQRESARQEYERYLRVDPSGSRAEQAMARLRELNAEPEVAPPPVEEVEPAPPPTVPHVVVQPASTRPAAQPVQPAQPNVRPEAVTLQTAPGLTMQEAPPRRTRWRVWLAIGAAVAVVGTIVAITVATRSGGCNAEFCGDLRGE